MKAVHHFTYVIVLFINLNITAYNLYLILDLIEKQKNE